LSLSQLSLLFPFDSPSLFPLSISLLYKLLSSLCLPRCAVYLPSVSLCVFPYVLPLSPRLLLWYLLLRFLPILTKNCNVISEWKNSFSNCWHRKRETKSDIVTVSYSTFRENPSMKIIKVQHCTV
jgi:hypothetical protein